jgi:toxin HigB-1
MIGSYRDRETRKIAQGQYSKRFPVEIQARARLCLERISAAAHPADLAAFPAMRLKKLAGTSSHVYSVRVNRQYRICFEWRDGQAVSAALTDYH